MHAVRFHKLRMRLARIVVAGLFLAPSTAAYAVPILQAAPGPKEVKCGAEGCGTMDITQYDLFSADANGNPPNVNAVSGVTIRGEFTPAKNLEFHFLQAVTTYDMDELRWFHDTTVKLPVPYLDTPPGGYKAETGAGSGIYGDGPDIDKDGVPDFDQSFDYFPWYDRGGEFPVFLDEPKSRVQEAKLQPDLRSTDRFETWLVSVIADVHDNDNQAKDDKYKVLPLLGWTWGFDIFYQDVATMGVDDIQDFVVTKIAFDYREPGTEFPSGDWLSALAAKYGAGALQDFYNITVPEPSTVLLFSLPALLMLLRFANRRCCAG